MVQQSFLICLVSMLTQPCSSMALLPISSILSLVFGKDLKILFFCFGNMLSLSFLIFQTIRILQINRQIKFTMEIAGYTGCKFLHLKQKIKKPKMRVGVYAKSPNSFSKIMPNICYPKNNIGNIRVIHFRLRRICDDDETFKVPKLLNCYR